MSSFDLLQPRRDALQVQFDLLSEKLRELRLASAIEAGVSAKFQLDKEIEQTETALDRIEQQLEDLERLSGDGRLYQALLKLGYRKQVQTFRKFVQSYPVSAFLSNYSGLKKWNSYNLRRNIDQFFRLILNLGRPSRYADSKRPKFVASSLTKCLLSSSEYVEDISKNKVLISSFSPGCSS
jgi:hypothetical protein